MLSLFVPLGANLALLSLLTLIYDLLDTRLSARRSPWRAAFLGFCFGLVTALAMMVPVEVEPGILVDAKALGPSLAAYFLGPWGGLSAVLLPLILRWFQGGGGMVAGLCLILTGATTGLLLRRYETLNPSRSRVWYHLPLMGLGIFTASILLAMAFFPSGLIRSVASRTWVVMLLLYPGGDWFAGTLLRLVEQRRRQEGELRRAEERRQERDAQFRALVDNLPRSMVYQVKTDSSGLERRFMTLSEGCRTLHGLEAQEVIDDPGAMYATIHPEDLGRLVAEEGKALKALHPFTVEVRFAMPDGRYRWSLLRSAPRLQGSGEVIWDGIETDIDQQKIYLERLKRSLEERDVLLRELQHRTKNTIQEVQSLLLLNAGEYPGSPDVASLVASTTARLQAIALVQELLYRSEDLTCVGIDIYVRSLVDLITRRTALEDGGVDLQVCSDTFPLDDLIPLGLIINEVLTNSRKYAPGAMVHLSLQRVLSGDYQLDYRDEGPGLPRGLDALRSRTLGLRLVQVLAEGQLGGSYSVGWHPDPGFSCRIVFRKQDYGSVISGGEEAS